jgi:uncharacterized protein YndB with AHSA1/START domain
MSHPAASNPSSVARRPQPSTTVLLARRLSAPPERVFDAWLDPGKIKSWIVGPSRSDDVLRVFVEPQVGGTFSIAVVRNGEELEHLGSYVEIYRPRRLSFTWNVVKGRDVSGVRPSPGPGGSLVTLDLAPAGTGTELRLTHEGVPEDAALRTEDGWSKIIQALANSLGT